MASWLARLFGGGDEHPEVYDPVYGLPKASVERWLARNPHLREDYERRLAEYEAIRRERARTELQ
jgi:hypothetical protein